MFNRLYKAVLDDRNTNGAVFNEFASQYYTLCLQKEANKAPAKKKQRTQKVVVFDDLSNNQI